MRNAWFFKRFFYQGKYVKKKERNNSIALLLLPSVLGICLCIVCVCGMTWAWYTASVETPTQSITAAYYTVVVDSVENEGTPVSASDGNYTLTAGQIYTIKLRASGTVQNCGGYCLIAHNDVPACYTQTFKPDETITITIQPEETGVYTFSGVWGSLPNDVKFIKDGGSMPAELAPTPSEPDPSASSESSASDPIEPTEPSDSEPTEPSDSTPTEPSDTTPSDSSGATPSEPSDEKNAYTVQDGDTLLDIAEKFGVTTEQLVVYNNLGDADSLHSGQVLQIPPKDWDLSPVTEDPTDASTQPDSST